MSYRSFKRVLGETSLERKCRTLFGACLLLLITGAFWYAERNAENLVKEKTKKTGQDYVDLSLLRYHYETNWEHAFHLAGDADAVSDAKRYPRFEMLKAMNEHLLMQNYAWEILVLDDSTTIDTIEKTRLPRSDDEQQILLHLEQQLSEQLAQRMAESAPVAAADAVRPIENQQAEPAGEATPAAEAEEAASEAEPAAPSIPLVPVSWLEADDDNYYYYQPVYWRERCFDCHLPLGTPIQSDLTLPPELRGPLRVIKVSIPSEETQHAIAKSRGILLATAIITVFLSMIALYLVVRYVIVKPLNHLRDVSDEISRGNINLRAEIQTNDEFEELAQSFNRMLRHLTDTQDQLRNLNIDLDAKVDQLAQANMQLHEMNRLKSDFLANMSHELRTPLNSIIGFSDVLRGIDSLNSKQQRYVDNIGKSGRMLLEMINDILDLAKMESGKMELRLTEFAIEPVITAQCDLVRALSEEKNIDLKVEVQPQLPLLHQDQSKVQQVLTNLLSNAIKFTPEGGRITVSARRDLRDHLVLTVTDTGVGIAEEDRQIIFEKFRQGSVVLGEDALTRKFSGTGLGLSIVKELCKLLGGEISFESELGKGSSFTVRLPWRLSATPPAESSLAARLDEVTKSRRLELTRSGDGSGAAANSPSTASQTTSSD